ncbi:hypothetical protein AG1IA_08996 [Rhizoctonia solani AG-1 IA]|uniref:Heat shock 70 kDa protein 12A n=1 Tax=Thanatephorus cucumeris (strain AG1-IA) TaxID=983506 RepID=L8WJI1_THACA|nr:hypothetical protein AG1IA_08996 [Rhizoctonia solani AG-1 IA]
MLTISTGARQTIHRVTKWPGQDAHNQQGKIPTLVWYNSEKKAVAFGAEAQLHTTEEQAEDHGWFLAKHFKLHLHPEDMQSKYALKLDGDTALPPGVGLQQIYSDFLEYLLKHTKIYFEDRMLDGKKMWEKYGPEMEVVIAHPNGWGIREQTFLRSAAVAAGFAMASKVRFVTEAEASVHFCIHHTNLGDAMRFQPGTNFAVCDAGGSTVDTTLYSVASISPTLKLEEKRASACEWLCCFHREFVYQNATTGVQAGAIFIDFEMERYLKSVLTKAELDPEDVEIYTKTGVKDFETFAKRVFRDEKTEHSILLAHSRFSNTAIRTRRGRMTVPGYLGSRSTIQKFFDTCVDEIKKSVDRQLDGLDVPVGHDCLVSRNEYVRNEFRKRYEPNGSRITLGNDSSSKAVADGATIWGIASSVVSRAPRYSFGKKTSRDYDPLLHDPQGRKAYVSLDGKYRVSGGWSEIVHKVGGMQYYLMYKLNNVQVQLMAYTGDDRGGNLNNLRGALKAKKSPLGVKYWKLKYQVCIRFGGTELESYLEWRENGVTRTGPVSIIVPPDASYGY